MNTLNHAWEPDELQPATVEQVRDRLEFALAAVTRGLRRTGELGSLLSVVFQGDPTNARGDLSSYLELCSDLAAAGNVIETCRRQLSYLDRSKPKKLPGGRS